MFGDEIPADAVKFDQLLSGTPFRGLILWLGSHFVAYIGVPKDHWLANMEDLQLPCHFGVNFRREGGDGIRPEGWYWYGWDYAHFTDYVEFPAELLALLPEDFPLPFRNGKRWSVAEIEQDLIDAAVHLNEALTSAREKMGAALAGRPVRD